MSSSNRELSQFGSFVYIDDSSRKIAITTESTPFVGIGTTNPERKLHVLGDVKVEGAIDFQGNLNLGNSNLNTTGIITASAFFNELNEQLVAYDSWAQDDSNIYRLIGNVGIGTSIASEKLTVSANVSASQFISTVSTGTAPFQVTSSTEVTNLNSSLLRGGIPGSNINSFDIVTLGADQTLSRKTLVSPVVTGAGITFNGTSTGRVTLRAATNPGTPTVILPSTNGTLVSTGDTGVITSNMLADLTITDADVAIGAGITYSKLFLTHSITNADIASNANIDVTKLSSRTISGVSLGSTLSSLSAGNFINFSSGSTYNGSAPITVSVAATTSNSGNTVVSRNSSGDFSAGTVSVINLSATETVQGRDVTASNLVSSVSGNFSGIVTATRFNATGSITINGDPVLTATAGIGSAVASIYGRVFTVGVNTSLVNRDFCEVVGAGITITLPPSPSIGNEVKIGVGTFINTVVARNGSNIMSLAEDLTIDIEYLSVGFLYVGGSIGWRIV